MKLIKKVSEVIDNSKKPKIITKEPTLKNFLEGDATFWYRDAFICADDCSGGNDTSWRVTKNKPRVVWLENDYSGDEPCSIYLETLKKVIIKLYGK